MVTEPVITVDGPSGAGKGTLCTALAKILQWHVLDSGAIYRVLTVSAMRHQTSVESEDKLVLLATHLDVSFKINHDRLKVLLEGKDISQAIRNENIDRTTSLIAALPRVREALLMRQRQFRVAPGLVADGRDMGTVVFPDASVKIFLDASSEERAYRRMRQLQKKGFNVNFNRLLLNIRERDNRDRSRSVAPLVPADDALLLDSTYLTTDEVVDKAIFLVRKNLFLP